MRGYGTNDHHVAGLQGAVQNFGVRIVVESRADRDRNRMSVVQYQACAPRGLALALSSDRPQHRLAAVRDACADICVLAVFERDQFVLGQHFQLGSIDLFQRVPVLDQQ
jgi:hypothetical protein